MKKQATVKSAIDRSARRLAERRENEIRERIVNDDPKLLTVFEPGDVAHQGDLILVAIAALPESAQPRADRQLAEGSTQGSRHVLERGAVYSADPDEIRRLICDATGVEVGLAYLGPVFVSPTTPTEHDLTHPEHGDLGFPAGTVCAVVYQRSLDAEEREARVRD